MKQVYLVIITNDTENISVYGALSRAKAALRERMETLLDENEAISDDEKASHKAVFEKTLSYGIPYVPNYDVIESVANGYIEYGEIRTETLL